MYIFEDTDDFLEVNLTIVGVGLLSKSKYNKSVCTV